MGCCRNFVSLQKVFTERLRPFELGSSFTRAETRQSCRIEVVHQSRYQRHFRANNGKANPLALSKSEQPWEIIRRDIDIAQSRLPSGTRIPRRNQHLGNTCTLHQLPRQGMFTPTATNHQYFHYSTFDLCLLILSS